MTAPDAPDWFDWALRFWAVGAPIATYIFGRITKGEINDARLTSLMKTVGELEDTVKQHGEQLAAQQEINRQLFQMRSDVKDISSKLDRVLGRMDAKEPRNRIS